MKVCSANKINDSNWSLSIDIGQDQSKDTKKKPVALHYVVDNSSSMGSMTRTVQDIFSDMIDNVATAPCSMTVFSGDAKILSSNITTGKQMRGLTLPGQGCTNIPAGIEKALRIIYGQEMKYIARSGNNDNCRIHHIMILLSDGEHNKGRTPDQIFPMLGEMLPKDAHLSVIIVGFSRHSNTSMGMLLKKSIESVSFDTDSVQTIYFANSSPALKKTLKSLETELNGALKGSVHQIEAEEKTLVEDFQRGPETKLSVHLAQEVTNFVLLHCASDPPDSLLIDGEEIKVYINEEEDVSVLDLSKLIQNLIDKTKIQIVAAKDDHVTKIARDCASKLNNLVEELEARASKKNGLQLAFVSPKKRVQQYRIIRAVCSEARALRNQVLDIANFSIEGSEEAASFLNGRDMKYASKALRRAAKKAGDVALDPKAERQALWKELKSADFRERLRLAMHLDVLDNLVRLSNEQFENMLLPFARNANNLHGLQLQEIRQKLAREAEYDATIVQCFSPSAKDMVTSGKLAEYLNEVFHGNRRSYMTLSSPWEHIAEWEQFEEQNFDSTWEMLMYAGSIGYPIALERSAASQMNPYLTVVKEIRTSISDTASICCANQAMVPVYGPEGSEPVQDVLQLIDPSMPRSSNIICGGKLLGEKYTSAVLARDLQMYTGFNMRIALHGNTLFHLLAAPATASTKNDFIANLRRTLVGRAYQCGFCSFGPVDHFACSDLMSHHGENRTGAVVNNACPRCGWFSAYLEDWSPWDGNVCEEFIRSEMKPLTSNEKLNYEYLPEAKIDLILRILYSFQKMTSSTVKEEYSELAKRMTQDSDFSAKAGIDGMSQLLLAVLAPHNGGDSIIADAVKSESCIVSVIQEACAREARQIFRAKSCGNKELSKELARDFITDLLGVEESSAPFTLPQMQAEPSLSNVRLDCRDYFKINEGMLKEISWVRDMAIHWCRAWSFARGFCKVVASREGGWDKIEKDMETGLASYQDVVDRLKEVKMEMPREFLGVGVGEAKSLFLRIGVGAIFAGVLGTPFSSDAFLEDEAILREAAREMRVIIYLGRVRKKMAEWKVTGERTVYFEAMAADIAQFCDMVGMSHHVHGFDKATFWGLWAAAKNTENAKKIKIFLSTACESFYHKHYEDIAKIIHDT